MKISKQKNAMVKAIQKLGEIMGEEAVCDYPGCGSIGDIISRLSPEGYLVATGKKAYSFREAYRRFHYCGPHHDELMGGVWSRVRKPDDKDDGHIAPTAI
ncbi:MAG: hypothetical protein QGI21_01525 [Candidatus Poseidoniaceae archaeon]|jgi:hypothetical protein|nr:hypothetical protein [Candidatus Poseidoniaceae archaeon]